MTKPVCFIMALWLMACLISACGSSDSSLPTLRPTVDNQPTVDPNLGSGFDPNLGTDTSGGATNQPTPTRESSGNIVGDTESGASGSGFTASLSGNTSVSAINDGGIYACNIGGHQIISGAVAAPNVSFILPVNVTIGTHSLKGINDITGANDTSVLVTLTSASDLYNQGVSGTLSIDALPTEDGDFVTGSFDFSIANASNSQITLSGSFDFESNNTTYCTS